MQGQGVLGRGNSVCLTPELDLFAKWTRQGNIFKSHEAMTWTSLGVGPLFSLPPSLARKLITGFDNLEFNGVRTIILSEDSLDLVEE